MTSSDFGDSVVVEKRTKFSSKVIVTCSTGTCNIPGVFDAKLSSHKLNPFVSCCFFPYTTNISAGRQGKRTWPMLNPDAQTTRFCPLSVQCPSGYHGLGAECFLRRAQNWYYPTTWYLRKTTVFPLLPESSTLPTNLSAISIRSSWIYILPCTSPLPVNGVKV